MAGDSEITYLYDRFIVDDERLALDRQRAALRRQAMQQREAEAGADADMCLSMLSAVTAENSDDAGDIVAATIVTGTARSKPR